jgi:hypothetical protein
MRCTWYCTEFTADLYGDFGVTQFKTSVHRIHDNSEFVRVQEVVIRVGENFRVHLKSFPGS